MIMIIIKTYKSKREVMWVIIAVTFLKREGVCVLIFKFHENYRSLIQPSALIDYGVITGIIRETAIHSLHSD